MSKLNCLLPMPDLYIHLTGFLGSLSLIRNFEYVDSSLIGFCLSKIFNLSLKKSNFWKRHISLPGYKWYRENNC